MNGGSTYIYYKYSCTPKQRTLGFQDLNLCYGKPLNSPFPIQNRKHFSQFSSTYNFYNKLITEPARRKKIKTCRKNYTLLTEEIKIHSRTFLFVYIVFYFSCISVRTFAMLLLKIKLPFFFSISYELHK